MTPASSRKASVQKRAEGIGGAGGDDDRRREFTGRTGCSLGYWSQTRSDLSNFQPQKGWLVQLWWDFYRQVGLKRKGAAGGGQERHEV